MKGKAKPNLTRILRIGIAASLFLIIVIILVYFVNRSRRQPKASLKSKEITQQKIEKKEKIVHFEVEGERGNFLIKANKHYVGENNNYHLEGEVEIIDFGKEESQNVFIYGEEVIYDKDMSHFVLKGQSEIRYKDMIMKSNSFDYDKKREVFKSNKGVSISSRRLLGSAQKMVYSVRQESLRLKENIRLQLIPKSENTLPLIVEGERLDYDRKEKAGEVKGEVNLSQGKNKATAHTLKFFLSRDEENVKKISLIGEVKASLVEEEKDLSQDENPFFASKGKRDIEADELNLDGFKNLSLVSSISAKGNCLYKAIASSKSFIQIQAESLLFNFNREGLLKNFNASKKVRMIEYRDNSGEKRLVEGAEMDIQGKTKALQIKGRNKVKARVSTEESEIFAEEITIFLEDNNLDAKGGVKVVFKGRGEKESIGFFSKEQPVFITAQEMRYLKEKKRFLFNKDIKAWQQKKMLLANELSLFEEKRKILCSGGVKSIFFHKMREKKGEEKIEISADKMSFNPKNNIISYEENSSLKVRDINIRAQSISVHLKEEKGEMKVIVAQGKVNIVQEKTEGKGEKARYDLEKEAIILTGDPVVVDKDRGMTRGDKLTFYMGNGRITIENKERERSVTVIKS